MIDYEKSAELNGMEVEELKVYFEKYPGSGKRVIVICDNCGKIRNVTFQNYSPLCHKCANGTPEMVEAKRIRGIEQYSTQEACDEQAKRLKQYHIDNPGSVEKMSKDRIQYYEENPEVKKVISESVVQYNKVHPEAGRLHSEWMIQYYQDNPEVLTKKTKMWQEYWSNQDNRDEMSEIIKQYNINHPEMGENHSEWMRKYWSDPSNRDFQVERLNQFHIDNPEWAIEQSERLRQFHIDNPEAGELMSKRMKKYNENPEVRMLRSDKLKQYNIDHPEAAERRSAFNQGISYDEWEGFSEGDWRDWNNTIYINEPFPGCHRHHITKTIAICIPAELHGHIWHNLKTGLNMGEINALAIQFINGGL